MASHPEKQPASAFTPGGEVVLLLVYDPILKAGQDPAGGVADGLATKKTSGPLLEYYGSFATPTTLGAAASGETIYCDTLDVTDADWLSIEVMLVLNEDTGDVTTSCNIAIGLESSKDGIYWSPIGVIDRVNAFAPATMFRDDTGLTVPSTTGGFADAATTQNAPMLEDMVPLFLTSRSAVAAPVVKQFEYSFVVTSRMYVRVAVAPIYSEAAGTLPPSLAIRASKSAG